MSIVIFLPYPDADADVDADAPQPFLVDVDCKYCASWYKQSQRRFAAIVHAPVISANSISTFPRMDVPQRLLMSIPTRHIFWQRWIVEMPETEFEPYVKDRSMGSGRCAVFAGGDCGW